MAEYVKVCPRCHFQNPDTVNSCQRCPASLGGVAAVDPDAPDGRPRSEPPTQHDGREQVQQPDPDLSTACRLVFESVDVPTLGFGVSAGETLGASGHADEPDVALTGVPGEDYISGRHLRVLRHGSDWFVQHVGKTNYIVVDGVRYAGRDEVPVRWGSSVFLTHTEFIVFGESEM